MPIYEYRCEACGHQDEHLQKLAEQALELCPACGKSSYRKQLSAAGFQLKGSGWYATDFKGSGAKPAAKPAEAKAESKPDAKSDAKAESKPESKPETKAVSQTESKSGAAA